MIHTFNLGKNLFWFIVVFTMISTNSYTQLSNSNIKIYFTRPISSKYIISNMYPYQSGGSIVKQQILDVIKSAKFTIDVCVYNNSDADIVSALKLARNKGLRVRYITDKSTSNPALKNLNFPILYLGYEGGIMHNKFIIADAGYANATLSIGSTNFTPNGFNDDANNLIIINDIPICNAFVKEFEEMWNSSTATPGKNPKSGSQKSDNTPHSFNINEIPIQVFFSPSDQVETNILRQLDNADYNLRFAIFTFTSDSLAEAIVNKKKEGLSIRGITDNNSDFPGKLKYMQDNGVDVIDHSPSSQLHHKYAIIDAEYVDSDPVVITGSHNWTWSANNINDESTLFIHDSDIAKLYSAEFNSRYCELAPWDCNLLKQDIYSNIDVKISPTLFLNSISILLPENIQNIAISILDINGKPVFFNKLDSNNLINLDLSFLSSGSYFIQLQNNSDNYGTFKIIKL
jgi:phosphatidylserine/phosphatidylglycerophosphate/cardiolipin synthase-like enzyme